MSFEIALVQPEIPHNTGAIGRLCVGLGLRLHLVKPLGFQITNRFLRRAGLDYWEHLDLVQHPDLNSFLSVMAKDRMWLSSSSGKASIYDCDFGSNPVFVFGSESSGPPRELREALSDRSFFIPMPGRNARSLNLAQAVAVAAYEMYRRVSQAEG